MVAAATTHRRDAVRNRLRLLDAARQVFAADGVGGSLEAVARRAGVGVGTLYRHFPSRGELVAALFEDETERWVDVGRQAAAAHDAGTALRRYLTGVLELQAGNRLLHEVLLRQGPGESHVAAANAELARLAEELLVRARDEGAVRPDFTVADLALVVWSFAPVIEATRDIAPHAWRRQLTLVLDGLRTPAPTPYAEPPLTADELAAAQAALLSWGGAR